MKELSVGLTDIFSSKIDSGRRESALSLSGSLCHVFGIEWAVQNGTKFLLLWLHLVVVVSECLTHCYAVLMCYDGLFLHRRLD